MASLTGSTIASSYTSLLKLDGNTASTADGDGSNAIQVKTGDNDATPLYLNTDRLGIGGQPLSALMVQTTNALDVTTAPTGSISFGSPSSTLQGAISGRQTSNTTALHLMGSGADGNTSGDMIFNVRENDNSTFATLTNSAFKFQHFSTDLVTILRNGNVGIGENSPNQLLHLKATNGSEMVLQRTSGDTSNLLGGIHFGNSDVDEYLSSIYSYQDGATDSAYLSFHTEVTGGAKAERMRITSAGLVGIGATPILPLTVQGASGNIANFTNGTNSLVAYVDNSNVQIANNTALDAEKINMSTANNAIEFYQGGSKKMTLTSTGLGIGASPQTALSPNLTIEGASPALILRDSNSLANNFYTIYSANGDIEHYFDHEKSVSFATTTDYFGSGESTKLKIDGATGNSDFQGNYIVNEQGRQNHVANTMSSPYYRFDGVDDLITTGTYAYHEDVTVTAWVRSENPSSARQEIISLGNNYSASDTDWILYLDTDGTYNGDVLRESGYHGYIDSGVNVCDGKWHHLALTVSGGTSTDGVAIVYVNGVAKATNSSIRNFTAENGEFHIGARVDGGGHQLNGEIAGITVWNKTATATEIKELYSGASVPFKYKGANQTSLVTGDDSTFASDTGFWTKNAGSGTSVTINNSSNGLASYNAVQSGYGLQRANLVEKAKAYRVTFTISNYSAGGIKAYAWGARSSSAVSSNGTHNVEFVAGSLTDTSFWLEASGTTTLDIDNLTVTPIGAVAEYDGSGIASDKWLDKSGNDLHGTITAGATAPTVENAPANDDGLVYDEGTWTPLPADASSGGNTASAGTATGYYTRIGRMVHCEFNLVNINTTGMTSGNDFFVQGLPYVVASHASHAHGSVALENVNFTGEYVTISPAGGTSAIRFAEVPDNSNIDIVIVSEINDDSADIYGHFSYMVT